MGVLCSGSDYAIGQIVIDRNKVLAFDMRPVKIGPYKFSGSSTAPVEWTQPILAPPGTDLIRIHVAIKDSSGAKWTLKFKSLDGSVFDAIESGSPRTKVKGAWSAAINSRQVIVDLVSDVKLQGLTILIDEYARPTTVTFSQALWGTDNRESILAMPSSVQKAGRAVARLRIMTLGGEALCTGFLVTTNLLLTNQHCVEDASEALGTMADFGFDSDASVGDQYAVESLELTASPDSGLDYSLLRVSGNPGQKYGHLDLASIVPSSAVKENYSLLVIEHAGGQPKQVSMDTDCEVAESSVVGIQPGVDTDFGHHCDTLGGASGSPIFDRNSTELVGLHHMGFTGDSVNVDNQGIYLGLITQDIKNQSVAIYGELIQGSH